MTDIQAGDVVVCVDAEPIICEHNYLHRGRAVVKDKIGRVVRFKPTPSLESGQPCGCPSVVLDNGDWGVAQRFRKIDKADDEFTRTVRACKPIIPELPRVSVEIVKLDPEMWPAEIFEEISE